MKLTLERQSIPLTMVVFLSLSFVSSEALARCVCRCVDGEIQALCDNSLEIAPICPPRVCPIVPPSVQPIMPPKVPPIGTDSCSKEQVFNKVTGRYEWKTICR